VDYRQRPFETTEFTLIVECCRWAFAGGCGGEVERLAANVAWPRVLRLARRHRVQGLVWNCLRTLAIAIPADVAEALSGDAASIAERNLRAAWQSARLYEAFTRAGLPLIFIKGLTLGKLAYPDPLTKMSLDIDMLVPAGGAAGAAAELRKLGYDLVLPHVEPGSGRFEAWHQRRKESVWRSPDGVQLDLHTRLADSPALLAGIDVRSPTQLVEVAPGIRLPTLARDELVAYLCVHGASSAWFRLKWVTDLAALLHGATSGEIERLHARALSLGAGRAAAQALLVADRVYGMLGQSALKDELVRSSVNRWLAGAAWSQLNRDNEPTEAFLGTAAIHLTQLFLLPGTRFKRSEVRRQVSDALRRAG
jgi:hypothetical protein